MVGEGKQGERDNERVPSEAIAFVSLPKPSDSDSPTQVLNR